MRTSTLTILLVLGLFQFAHGQGNGFCNLVWSDEFNGATLSSAWTKEQSCDGGGNNEMECYTGRDKNVFIDNGNLVLKAYRETYTGSQAGCTSGSGCTNTKPYTSGRVNTAKSNSWTYGRFETRAKLPSGIQLWPAIWMLPTDYKYGGWAASGEIDIMESRGNNPFLASGTLHHGGAWPNNIWTTSGDHSIGVDLSADFHVYTLEWTRDTMTWYIDNTMTQQYNMNRWWSSSGAPNTYSAPGQPFDQRFHFILNLAVGGGFFGSDAPVTDAQSAAWKQPELRVDYVRVWQQGGNCNGVAQPTSQPSQAADGNARPTQSAPTQAAPGTCNGQGFDASRYTCATNEVGRQVLCSLGGKACGSACYNPSQYCCNNGNLGPAGSCPNQATTTQTTAATTTTAAAPTTSANPGACNGQSYNPAAYTCTLNDANQQVLCNVGMSSCGSACYNPSLYCCQRGGLVSKGLCPAVTVPTRTTATTAAPTSAAPTTVAPATSRAASPGTCNGQGFDAAVYTCTTNNLGQSVLCPMGQQSCGNACFNPSSYCCKSGNLTQKNQC